MRKQKKDFFPDKCGSTTQTVKKINNGDRSHPRMLKTILILANILLLSLILCGCADAGQRIDSLDQLREPGKKIAVKEGTPEELLVQKDFPDAQILTSSDLVAAYTEVSNGIIDAFIHSRSEMEAAMRGGVTGVRLLDEDYCENIIAVGLSRVSSVPELRNRFNTFLKELKDGGVLDEMYTYWVVEGNETMPDIPKAENPEGVLRVATTGSIMPYSFYVGDDLAGFDVELAERFAAWLNMEISYSIYDFNGIFQAVQTGDVDCAMSNLYYTEEHAEAIDFSDPLFTIEVTAMVSDGGAPAADSDSFRDRMASGFEKTFIREGRWKLLLQGACITLLITALAVVLGTALGFSVYLLCRRWGLAVNTVTRASVRLIHGIPVVVFLMILYYVIFGKIQISRTLVSVLGFTILFGADVYSMLKTGVGTVDRGQSEAASSLGFPPRKAFFRIVLPQAVPYMLPVFTEQVTALIKATSVVGYIAVQDLTKMGDIIRGRTYEAFFPLVTIAAIYFALAELLTFAVRRIGRQLDTRQRKDGVLLKGVNLHD